jgi:hypothetical protein
MDDVQAPVVEGEAFYIPIHEAGHCLVMHCQGQRIEKVRLFRVDGESLGRTYPVDPSQTSKAVLMAGYTAQRAFGIAVSTNHVGKDMVNLHKAADSPEEAKVLIEEHFEALRTLAELFVSEVGRWVSGDRVHDLLESAGVPWQPPKDAEPR